LGAVVFDCDCCDLFGQHREQEMTGWRKRQIALDIKAENARELGLDYEPDKTIMDMARESWIDVYGLGHDRISFVKALEAFAELVREDALVQQAPVQEPVAWMEMVVANLVREGVNKHNARELAEHFYTTPPAQPAPVQKKSQQFTSEMNYSNNFKQGERNFCPRCGKRAGDYIHTYTPSQEQK